MLNSRVHRPRHRHRGMHRGRGGPGKGMGPGMAREMNRGMNRRMGPGPSTWEQACQEKDGSCESSQRPRRRAQWKNRPGDGVQYWQKFMQNIPRRNAFFGKHDVNKDGKISRQEFRGAKHRFDELDRNKDGTIEKSEISVEPGQKAN